MCVRQQKKQNDYFAFRIPQIPKHEKGGYQRFLKIRPAGGAVGRTLKKRVSADFPMSAQKYGGFDQKSTLTFSIFYPILLYGVNMSLNFHKNNFRR